ncbi:MOSC domain-containing protein [Inhella gelatinilytica]|uniref:MOSC domain-containing protein n=1 Tax=Inhella gelatinilytica TaxID=2795030 RepID=A0A931IW81_9BURK|nr:MOSC domain-containing protein [Inhella gelatinilytica]MBH9552164.1 MOSC domain-containing protein [Inhella gelatinilytica]
MKLISLNTAPIQPLRLLDGTEVASAYQKQGQLGPRPVSFEGIEGDAQADRSVHGGPQQALYAYPSEHYAVWQTLRAQARAADWGAPLPWGSLGENLTLAGLLESQVWIGDVLQFPDCELIVTRPRQPCVKLNAALGFPQAARLMQQSGYSGFYVAVRQPGTLAQGQPFQLVPGPRELALSEWEAAQRPGG